MSQSSSLTGNADEDRIKPGNIGESDVPTAYLVTQGVGRSMSMEARQEEEFSARPKKLKNICADCGEPISEARRKAQKFATRCTKCQSKQEEEAN